jgi:hypothetical protein
MCSHPSGFPTRRSGPVRPQHLTGLPAGVAEAVPTPRERPTRAGAARPEHHACRPHSRPRALSSTLAIRCGGVAGQRCPDPTHHYALNVSRLGRLRPCHRRPAQSLQSLRSLPARSLSLCLAYSRRSLCGVATRRFLRSVPFLPPRRRWVRSRGPGATPLAQRVRSRAFRTFRPTSWVRFADFAASTEPIGFVSPRPQVPLRRSELPVWQILGSFYEFRRLYSLGSAANTAVLGSFRAGVAVPDIPGGGDGGEHTIHASIKPRCFSSPRL